MEPKYVDISAFMKELGDDHGGMSQPVVVMAEDGLPYVLKTEYTINAHWHEMFFHEILVAQIAEYLGVLVPPCAIAYVDKRFIDSAPTLQFRHRYREGLHFASQYLKDNENNLKNGYIELMRLGKPYIKRTWKSFFDGVSNPDTTAAAIIVLDIYTANFDRFGNYGNLLIAQNNGRRSIYAVDHGHCFNGPFWNTEKSAFLRSPATDPNYVQTYIHMLVSANLKWGSDGMLSGLGIVFRELERFIDLTDLSNHSFTPYINKLRSINERIIDQWFSNIPDAWYVDKPAQQAFYKQFLLRQKDLVPMIISTMARFGAFTNYLGGDLQWNDMPTGTL
jgi:hypothetical protein